ncbi:futalosine hydrolase [Streptomyces sp. PLK6-54]|uniref:Futalosine hydrolase n=1 Tax=Actinacidiphila acidipaludis TaxID=2873382 RepID=A0ABS7QJ74_9ACTN|nr:futalosine hydrolase [Streptomyces acidipaludis]
MRPGRLLVVTAVAVERDAVVAGLARAGAAASAGRTGTTTGTLTAGTLTSRTDADTAATDSAAADVVAAGVGPAAAAAATATALARAEVAGVPYALVVSAGIGGGFAPAAPLGTLAVADAIVAADLGAETDAGFVPVTDLGFGTSRHLPPAGLSRRVAQALGAAYGPVLTVSTVTGTAERAAALTRRHPTAVAEAMEGFGVAEAAAAAGLPVLEIRAVSNAVGPRDRAAWRIGDALAALTGAFGKLPAALEVDPEHD